MLDPRRKNRITASSVGAILGLSPFMTRTQLMDQLLLGAKWEGNIATEYGHKNEPLARAKLSAILMEDIPEDVFYFNDWLGATPDGFTSTNDNVELKCPFGLRNGGEFKSIDDQPHYYAQIQVQMYLTNRMFTHFLQWSPFGYKHEVVAYSKEYMEEILPILREFYDEWQSRIQQDDIKRDDLLPIVEQIHAYDDQIAVLNDLRKELIEQLQAEANGKNIYIGNHSLKLVERKGSIDYKKALDGIDVDLEAFRKDGTSYYKLS